MKNLLLWLVAATAVVQLSFAQSAYPVPDVNDPEFPFYHGVASGDALEDRVILWTRVSGVSSETEVTYIVATDPEMTNVVMTGSFNTDENRDYTVKVDAVGLDADTWYYYQFDALDKSSPIGRTKTLPTELDSPEDFRFALASCANYEGGYFNSYRVLAERNDLDAVFFVGDYIYEYGQGTYGAENDRQHLPENEILSLEEYRARHSHYKLDIDLAAAHRQYPWYMSWDDHETANNSYATGAENHDPASEGDWYARRDAALQAYYEWNPVRDIEWTEDEVPSYRTVQVGDLATFYILETRLSDRAQEVPLPNVELLYSDPAAYLSDLANLQGIYNSNSASLNPERSMLGDEQKAWLQAEMASSGARWNVVVNQTVMASLPIADLTAPNEALGGSSIADVFFAQTGLDIGQAVFLSYDNWDGFAADRAWLYGVMNALELSNPLVLTGDIHSSWANTLVDFLNPTETVGVEFVTTQVAGNVRSFGMPNDSVEALVPWVEYFNQVSNGFTVIDLNSSRAQADYVAIQSTLGNLVAWNNPDGNTGIEDRVNFTAIVDDSYLSYDDDYRQLVAAQLGVDTLPRAVFSAPSVLAESLNDAPLATDATENDVNEAPFTLQILHNNDGESSLLHVDHFAAVVNAERESAQADSIPSLMLSSGDNFLAGFVFNYSQTSGTYYDALALDLIGYDALCLGNHDFDFGPEVLAEFINAYELSSPTYLSANLDFSPDPFLAPLAENGQIAGSTVVERDGHSIGIIGLTTPELPGISSPGDVIVEQDVVAAVMEEVNALEAQGINKIILVSHMQSVSNDVELASQLSGIDLIIAGGGDQLLTNDETYNGPYEVYGEYPLTFSDANGAPIHIVTTIGNYNFLGSLRLTFDANGVVTNTHGDISDVIPVPNGADAPSDSIMYAEVVAPLEAALGEANVLVTTEIAWDVRKPVIRARENGIGSIVADSYLAKAQAWAAASSDIDMPVLGLANGGGIRSNTVYSAGPITDQDIANILPFPNYIAIMEDVPAEVVKRIFENAYSQLSTDVDGEILGEDGRFAHISGGVITYDLSGEPYAHDASGATLNPGSRVVSLVLDNGTVVVENGQSVDGVTVDMASVDFSMNGGDFYPFDQAGQPVLTSEYLALDAFEEFLTVQLGGQVLAADYAELADLDAGRQLVIRPTCEDPEACTFGQSTTCFYEDNCGVCGGDGSSCIEGCTNPLACNYYELAVLDDGSCVVPTPGNPCPTQVEVYVTAGSDDAEEQMDPANPYYNGYPYMTSSDLELINDNGDQEVGIRFASLDVPAGATIVNAYIQFTADNSDSGETNLTVHVENSVNPVTYSGDVLNDVSGRPKYAESVDWIAVPAWSQGLAGLEQRTPDLSALVQHIVDAEGWSFGNAINFIITGSGEREAESFENDESDPSLAPKLVVSYQDLSGEGCTDAMASNYDPAATEDDGSCTYALSFQVNTGSDDIEETLNDDATYYDDGFPYMDSSDLELVEDGDANQAVGVRFTGLNLAQGQTIASAYIQFTADEVSTGTCDLTIAIQDAADNDTFDAMTAFDASGRVTLANTVAWSPADWNVVGETGEAQRTPDLSELVQAIVDKADWAPYNAMTFILTGSGSRIAEAYEGDPSAAARLVIEVLGAPVAAQGCTDQSAANYNPAAGVDDGSCIYTQVLTIAEIQQGQLTEALTGAIVQTSGVVTYTEGSFFALQDGTGAYSGISVYSSGNGLNVGDDITITGTVTEYNGLTELIAITELTVNNAGADLPAHQVITTNELNDEQWESVLVETSGTVTAVANQYGEWLINDGSGDAQIDDYVVAVPADLAVGQEYTVQGLSSYAYGSFELRATQLELQVVYAPCVLGTIYVSEAHSEGALAGYGNDYIEIYNSGDIPCSLEGFKLDDNDSFTDLTFGAEVIPADGFWWGVKDEPGSFESGLGANGDFVYLMDLEGNVTFVELAPAAESAAQIFDANGTGCFAFPTPGEPNGTCVTVGCVDDAACNFNPEAEIDNNSCEYSDGVYECDGITCINDSDGDGICDEIESLAVCQLGVVYVSEAHTSGDPADYIEIYNSGTEDCLLTGFQLDDNVELADLTFGTVLIEAGGYWLGYEDAPGSFNSGLSSGGDLVVFADPQGNMLIVEAGPSIANLSKSFDAEGNGCYTNPTPGMANEACGVVGCTDETACNYNAEATNDDGSCAFSDGIIDCNGVCFNDADSDGICDENEGLAGCTDGLAENFNPQATEDDGSCWESNIDYVLAGSYATGQFDAGAAEIVDYHPGTHRIFAVNAADRSVNVLDANDPNNLALLFVIDATAYGASANSVAVFGDFVAVAIQAEAVDALGTVVIFDVDGNFVSSAPCGYWPDALTVSHDGTMVAVANEGQPSDDYSIDPVGSATIIDVSDPFNPVATQVEFDGLTEADLPEGTRIFGPNASIAEDLEPEYVAFNGDDNKLFINCQENNCMVVADVATAAVTNVWSYGFKDHSLDENALDASNQDDAINITTWPVKGMYMPDAIKSYAVDGITYILTANEGDARDYDGWSEEARIKDLTLDPTIFPDAATLQANENLGRLLTSTTMGDIDGDGDYDELYSYGARSFTIWNEEGTLIFDSGKEFAEIVATLFPEDFNSNNSGNDSFDSRSDDKGCEPEGVEIGTINGRTYAFIGLERQSAVLIYDITDPTAPVYQRYLSNRDFSVSNNDIAVAAEAAGDLGPEGLKFISADESTDGMPYLITGNEISGTITAYALSSDIVVPACQLGVVYISEGHTSGEPEDYIELYNDGDQDCSLEGFMLDDNTALNDLTFGNVIIEAGGYWLGYEDAENSFSSGLSSGGDIIVLGDPAGNISQVTLLPSLGEYSQSFDAYGNGCYTVPTPGDANVPCEDTGLFTLDDLGCTYEGACNYDPSALFDDGSCFWLEGDLNGDGYVTSNDLLAFLANFATTCGE